MQQCHNVAMSQCRSNFTLSWDSGGRWESRLLEGTVSWLMIISKHNAHQCLKDHNNVIKNESAIQPSTMQPSAMQRQCRLSFVDPCIRANTNIHINIHYIHWGCCFFFWIVYFCWINVVTIYIWGAVFLNCVSAKHQRLGMLLIKLCVSQTPKIVSIVLSLFWFCLWS